MKIKYRKAAPDDIEEICRIVHDAVDAMERESIFQWDDLYPAQEDFQQDIKKSQLYVGSVNGQIAVLYTLNQECDEAYKNGQWKYKDEPFYIVHRLCVDPAFQNKGIAKSALFHIEQQLKEVYIHVIRLDVFSNNPFAVRLYDSLGYSKVGHAEWRKGKFFSVSRNSTRCKRGVRLCARRAMPAAHAQRVAQTPGAQRSGARAQPKYTSANADHKRSQSACTPLLDTPRRKKYRSHA